MKRFIKYIVAIIVIAVLIMISFFVVITTYPKGVFHDSYQSVIVDKYRRLQKIDDPKIIIVAGSSAAFGINQDMMEDETGYKVVNLGLQAGFGNLFPSELSKENINEGDIVLLAYEYDWVNDFHSMAQDLIMSGIDENIDMYKHIPIDHWKDFVGYLFKYAEKKKNYEGSDKNGIYKRSSFDQNTTQMIAHREYTLENPEILPMMRDQKLDLSNVSISDETKTYLRKYKKYVEDRGARVYFVSPPVLKKAVICDYKEFENLKNQEEEQIGIMYITDALDYLYDKEYMADTIYHCNNEGEYIRTKQLVRDLKKIL